MSSIDPNLLRPSLSKTRRPPAAPYSTQMGFFCAFLGGPIGVMAWALLNTWRTHQGRRDALPMAAMALVAVGWVLYAHLSSDIPALHFARPWVGRPDGVLMDRIVGLVLFGIVAWLQRREQRSAVLFGLPVPNGTVPGVLVIAAAFGVTLLAAAVAR